MCFIQGGVLRQRADLRDGRGTFPGTPLRLRDLLLALVDELRFIEVKPGLEISGVRLGDNPGPLQVALGAVLLHGLGRDLRAILRR
jgi:hypothetical protein